MKSPPSRGRQACPTVAPFTGAWIEILYHSANWAGLVVAPFTGAWIEIVILLGVYVDYLSLPSRERGLKFNKSKLKAHELGVAPFTGAWIEI